MTKKTIVVRKKFQVGVGERLNRCATSLSTSAWRFVTFTTKQVFLDFGTTMIAVRPCQQTPHIHTLSLSFERAKRVINTQYRRFTCTLAIDRTGARPHTRTLPYSLYVSIGGWSAISAQSKAKHTKTIRSPQDCTIKTLT